MVWIPIVAWIVAVVLAAVIVAFTAYELHWKSGRLQQDLAKLIGLGAQAQQVQTELDAARERAAAVAVPSRPTAS